ncbi:unnamed protein product [Rhizoctonia solani]|uniref:Major facilitator superfamily (MFS) profile domain-containing protein n=1 Tax=Rhizoctonia solani TaxID=456999 RepID=A0A8H2ZZG7_9AGAM|nr:unnamed protein product [Rhizoctonia solani]
MSQTATYEIELLDALPHLEHGSSFDRVKNPHFQTPDGLVEAEQYFSGVTSSNHINASTSGHTLTSTAVQAQERSGFRIGNIFVEDQVLYLAGSCMGVFAVGLNDTATGANLPSIQDYYHLNYEVVSLVFLAGFGGYLVSCMLNSVLQNTIGTRNVLVMAGTLYGGGSLLISFAPPFPAVMVGLCLMGFGGGFYEACLTSVISHVRSFIIFESPYSRATLRKFENSRFMNILYAFFGLGALVSPFVIGALAKAGIAWRLYYWFPFSLAVLVTISHFMLFKHYVTPSDHEEASEHKSVRAKFKQVMRIPTTWVGIVLIILSFAIADTLSNWLTSYLIDVKGSGPDVSRYQLSMFWAGLTAGRIFFSLPFIHVRERIGNTLLLAAMIGAIGLLWAVNSTISNWIAIAVAGFFLGPNTPGILSIISTRVPPSLKGITVSITIGLGLVGATLGPLLFGVAVGKVSLGLRVLPPVILLAMAREHPSVPKASSAKSALTFDSETDEEEVKRRKKHKVALAKKQSSAKDLSKLFVKDVDGEEEGIKFYIVEWEEWDVIADLRERITECGGEVVEERPEEGYSVVDPRTDEGELELATRSTRTRRVVSFPFIEESIERGSLVSPLESSLFIKEDRPVKFHLHNSLPKDEIKELRYEILLRGGNPDVDISETQVVIHSKEFRDKLVVDRRWRQIELFETSEWLKSCIARERFTITGGGGRLTVPPAPRPKLNPQPGRKPGAPRTEFTDHDDQCLIAWMAHQFGKNQAGRQGNRPYQVLVQESGQLWWTHRHTWHSWRERYKTKRVHFDPLIIQAVDESERNKKPKQLRVPEFPDTKENSGGREGAGDENESGEERGSDERGQEPRPSTSRAKARPTLIKRRVPDSSEVEDEPEQLKQPKQSSSQPTKPVTRASKKAKIASQPEAAPFIKTSASQKAREAPLRKPSTPPPSEHSNDFSPTRTSSPARVVPVREESPGTGPEDDQLQEDSQSSSTQLENGILDQAVLGGGAQGAVERYNAELARVVANEMEREESEEPYTFDDPDVDVVGITQIDTPPSIRIDMSQPEDDETDTESTGKSPPNGEAEETGETVLDTVEVRLDALANRFGAIYSHVHAYYAHAVDNGMNEAAAIDFVEKQLRANVRQEKGKGRAS